MKRLAIFVFAIMIVGCKSKKATADKPKNEKPIELRVTKLTSDDIDQQQKDKAYDLGRRVLMACNTSRFKPFTAEEATLEVRKNATEDRLTKTCHNFQLKYGTFKGVRFIEAYKDKKTKETIYRYKADYSKKIANKELRVTMNEQNLVSGIRSLDWKDEFK
jgi:uncharacterized lipoprotein YehR (DUF1307 family)